MATASVYPSASADQYFEQELAATEKHEFYRGSILAMAGGSYHHGLIIMNTGTALNIRLANGPCAVVACDVRLAVDADLHYTYPDLMVVCGEPAFQKGRPHTLANPSVIIEVLSPSTERADRGRKLRDYRRLASLKEYVLISQEEARAELYRPDGHGHWTLFEFSGLDTKVHFASLEIEIPAEEIYSRVNFALEPETA